MAVSAASGTGVGGRRVFLRMLVLSVWLSFHLRGSGSSLHLLWVASEAYCAICCGQLMCPPNCWYQYPGLSGRACKHPYTAAGGGQQIFCQRWAHRRGCLLVCSRPPSGARARANAVCVFLAACTWWGGQHAQGPGHLALCRSSLCRGCAAGCGGGSCSASAHRACG